MYSEKDHTIRYKDKNTKCIDLTGADTTNGNLLQLWECNGKPNQKWYYNDKDQFWSGTDKYKCIDMHGSDTTDAVPLAIWDCACITPSAS